MIRSYLGKTSLISLPDAETVSDLVTECELPILILNHFPSLELRLISEPDLEAVFEPETEVDFPSVVSNQFSEPETEANIRTCHLSGFRASNRGCLSEPGLEAIP